MTPLFFISAQHLARCLIYEADPLADKACYRFVDFRILQTIFFGYESLDTKSSARAAVEKCRHPTLLFGALEFIDRSGVKRASASDAPKRQLNDLFG